MEEEQYNNLINRIHKQFPLLKIIGDQQSSKKSNRILLYVQGEYEGRIGCSHKNGDNLIFGINLKGKQKKVKGYIMGEVNHKDLEKIFSFVQELMSIMSSPSRLKPLFKE